MALSCFEGPTSYQSVTPSFTASFMEAAQSTGLVSCRLSSSTMSLGSQPGRMGSPLAFIQME
eukprot:CAMPEP_0171276546 /NCGR_PEP_ID=MMETSP0790-20130122/63895_1 /TAXON_ID=2925 /ORGANISM="Alexandrium catenella, Strain OF101" /LENGTH=61 /DNA_ID=CAMNT_0011745647 /DNA_START=11 /DNA_END=196 /DNA_ORIENTATION=-